MFVHCTKIFITQILKYILYSIWKFIPVNLAFSYRHYYSGRHYYWIFGIFPTGTTIRGGTSIRYRRVRILKFVQLYLLILIMLLSLYKSAMQWTMPSWQISIFHIKVRELFKYIGTKIFKETESLFHNFLCFLSLSVQMVCKSCFFANYFSLT